MRQGSYEVAPGWVLMAKYGLSAENRPTIVLDPARVPPRFRHLIPLAEQFGISDDLIRMDVLDKTPIAELEAMREAVGPLDAAFDDWLAGPEANGPEFSEEYIAFSYLRMASEEF